MKTIVMTISIMAVIFMAVPGAIAGTTNDAQVDTTVTLTPAVNADLPPFEYNASPNVGVMIDATSTAYAITTANMLTGADLDTGMEFGTLSTATGYAQRAKTTDSGTDYAANGPVPPADEANLDGDGWMWQGGDGSSGT